MATRTDHGTSLQPVLAVAFTGSLGFSIVLPFLVFVVVRLGGNALVYGALGATYSALQLVGAPILGRWSDRYGRRRVLLVSQLGTLASWVIFFVAVGMPVRELLVVDHAMLGAFTVSVPLLVLFGARALDGLTGGNVSVANAYVADVTTEKQRGPAFGRMAVASNLGFVAGPAIAGLLGDTRYGEALPVLAAIAVAAVGSGIVFWGLREPVPCAVRSRLEGVSVGTVLGQEHKECYRIQARGQTSLGEALRPSRVRVSLAVHFLVFVAFNFFYIAFPVHAATGLRWTLTEVGVFFSVLGLLMASVQGPLLTAVSKVVSEKLLVAGGSLVLAAGFALFTVPSTAGVYGAAALVALGNGLMWPSLLSLISKAAGSRNQGTVQGFASSSAATASIVGLILGGVLYERLSVSVFLVAASITLVCGFVSTRIKLGRRHQPTLSPAAVRSARHR